MRNSRKSAISYVKIGRTEVETDCFLLSTQPRRRRQQILSSYCERDSTDYFLSPQPKIPTVTMAIPPELTFNIGQQFRKNRYNRFDSN